MAHFAELDSGNIVIRVLAYNNSDLMDNTGEEREWIGARALHNLYGGTWVQTSYNKNFRGNFASIGSYYDADKQEFVPKSPQANLVYDYDRHGWYPPIPPPEDDGRTYIWDDDNVCWVLNEQENT